MGRHSLSDPRIFWAKYPLVWVELVCLPRQGIQSQLEMGLQTDVSQPGWRWVSERWAQALGQCGGELPCALSHRSVPVAVSTVEPHL